MTSGFKACDLLLCYNCWPLSIPLFSHLRRILWLNVEVSPIVSRNVFLIIREEKVLWIPNLFSGWASSQLVEKETTSWLVGKTTTRRRKGSQQSLLLCSFIIKAPGLLSAAIGQGPRNYSHCCWCWWCCCCCFPFVSFPLLKKFKWKKLSQTENRTGVPKYPN